ncbi:MAG: ribosome silencing factor [Chitinophagaceae bacterium]|nr:MAG: ribosome silencing factor [Chitinophagaceae bacterium]
MHKKETKKNKQQLLCDVIADAISEKKGEDILQIDLGEVLETVTDYFIICHAKSNTQVKAIAENIIEKVKQDTDQNPIYKEGLTAANWILIDYFDVVVHIFQKDARDFYQLEDLWGDQNTVRLNK